MLAAMQSRVWAPTPYWQTCSGEPSSVGFYRLIAAGAEKHIFWEPQDMNEERGYFRYRYFDYIMALFVTVLVVSNMPHLPRL